MKWQNAWSIDTQGSINVERLHSKQYDPQLHPTELYTIRSVKPQKKTEL